MRGRVVGPWALLASAGVHGVGLGFGGWLLAQSFRSRESAPQPPPASVEVSVDDAPLALPEVEGDTASTSSDPTALDVDPLAVATGGGRTKPRPDLESPGRGGSREGVEASNLASSIDPLTLDRDPFNSDRSQVQRLRTSKERRTLDDRRATPSPMQLELLASGSGSLHERRFPSRFDPARGAQSGAEPNVVGAALGGPRPEPGRGPDPAEGAQTAGAAERQVQAGVTRGGESRDFRRSAAVTLARPWVPQARPAVPAEQRARQHDTLDSSQEVASRVASLIHASTLGGEPSPGVGGEPLGGSPGTSGTRGQGSRSSAAGAGFGGDISGDPELAGYHDALVRRLDRELANAFPKWAIAEGLSGRVIFELTLLKDGRIVAVRIVRPSGIEEYDQNVLTGARRVGTVAPLPARYGERALLRINWDALNLVVGRDGPGPGGHGK